MQIDNNTKFIVEQENLSATSMEPNNKLFYILTPDDL